MKEKYFQKVRHEGGKARGQQTGRCLLERKVKRCKGSIEIERIGDSEDKQRKKEKKI